MVINPNLPGTSTVSTFTGRRDPPSHPGYLLVDRLDMKGSKKTANTTNCDCMEMKRIIVMRRYTDLVHGEVQLCLLTTDYDGWGE